MMCPTMIEPLEHELELVSRAVLAAEDWAPAYANAPEQHAALIKQTARMQLLVMRCFRSLAKDAAKLVNWFEYSSAVFEQQRAMALKATVKADESDNSSDNSIEAYNVNVVINNDAVSQQDQQFIKVVFDTIATVQGLGVDSMEVERKSPIGLSSTSSIIQQLTTKQLANLVGMKVNKDGTIVPNPKAEYNIDETTRARIAQSIKTSIRLGEDHQQALKRLQAVIADPERADMIAHTETVRAYAQGRAIYARQSGATGKYWSDSNATDICADNAAQGVIPIDADFIGGAPNEPQHPNCKCIVVYVYGDDGSGSGNSDNTSDAVIENI